MTSVKVLSFDPMSSSVRTLSVLVAALGLAAAACVTSDGFCPCGSDPEDPLASHDALFAGEHLVTDECVCRCGEDPAVGEKKGDDGYCPDDGKACTDELGEAHELECY